MGALTQDALLAMKTFFALLCFFFVLSAGAADPDRVSAQLSVHFGAVNRVQLGAGPESAWIYQPASLDGAGTGRLLLTHSRRDVLPRNLDQFSEWDVLAPTAERSMFESPNSFWTAFRDKRFHDYEQQSTKVLERAFPVDRWVTEGDRLSIGDITLEVWDTPGYTRGSISYVGSVDGKRVGFTGDLIYEGGRVIDLYSFQDAIPEAQIRGYHGYAARLSALVASLAKLRELDLDLIVPARGPLIHHPRVAIDQLTQRVRALYRNYLSTNALNWYFKEDRMRLSGERVLGAGAEIQLMPYSAHLETPDWILSQSTSRLIVSDDGYGFLLDCGYQRVIDTVKDWIEDGLVRGVEGIFVTHFHDDHADQVQAAVEAFQCPVYALEEYRDVLENPSAYHLPALTDHPIRDVVGLEDGQTMRWREFDLSFHFYPGQAYYHGAMLVEKTGLEPIFFIGDSFSPSGMDDYCLLNRNLMHRDTGYFLCLEKLRSMTDDYWLINEHIPHIFRFSDVELGYLEQRYQERWDLLSELVPWDDPNYGIDEQWAVFYPYGAEMGPGARREFGVRLTNHSPVTREFRVTPRGSGDVKVGLKTATLKLPSRGTGMVYFEVRAPTLPGTYLVTADIESDGMAFESWIEGMITVE